MYSNLRDKQNKEKLKYEESAKHQSVHRKQKYIPMRATRALSTEVDEKDFRYMSSKNVVGKNNNYKPNFFRERTYTICQSDNFDFKIRPMEDKENNNAISDLEVKRSIQYKLLESEIKEQETLQQKQIFALNHILQSRNKQTDEVKNKNKKLEAEIANIKYQFLLLKMIEKEDEEKNYQLFKALEERVLNQMKEKEEEEIKIEEGKESEEKVRVIFQEEEDEASEEMQPQKELQME